MVNAGVVPNTRQHGVERETHKHRNQDGRHNGDAKLMEELTNDALHETDWQKHRNNRQGGGQHSKTNFLGTNHGCVVSTLAHLHMPHDVFTYHNGIVNQQAHTQRQRHECDHVDCEAKHAHEPESSDQ